ncbi:MAG: SH3 domain-containing protein [Candidatus Acidiferrales bacterium]
MLRNLYLVLIAACLLAAAPAYADDMGYIDCQSHSTDTVILAEAAKTSDVVASLHCGEQFTILLSGDYFTRIQTQGGRVGYVYSYLISRIDSVPTAAQPSEQTTAAPQPAVAPSSTSTPAQAAIPAPATQPQTAPVEVVPNSVFIAPMGGFETYLAAAFETKKVPLTVVADKTRAMYVISGTSEDKKAGWAKIAFLGDIHSDADASVQMVDQRTGAVVFAYAVNKKNTMHGDQTTAEACAKHLKDQLDSKSH